MAVAGQAARALITAAAVAEATRLERVVVVPSKAVSMMTSN